MKWVNSGLKHAFWYFCYSFFWPLLYYPLKVISCDWPNILISSIKIVIWTQVESYLLFFEFEGCQDTRPVDHESCPKCKELATDGKCDKTWKQVLRGQKYKKCRNGLESSRRNDKVKEWCEESCGECGKLNFVWINQIDFS